MSWTGSISGVLSHTLDKVGETFEQVAPYFLQKKDIEQQVKYETGQQVAETKVESERYKTVAIGLTVFGLLLLFGFLRLRRG